jgi:hypothetical protein
MTIAIAMTTNSQILTLSPFVNQPSHIGTVVGWNVLEVASSEEFEGAYPPFRIFWG